MPYIFVTTQNGGWDPALPIHLEYSSDLDPEIHGFLREVNGKHQKGLIREGRGTAQTECHLRQVLDGLEKLGFNLVNTAAYSYDGRSYNEYILHRELNPDEINPAVILNLPSHQNKTPNHNYHRTQGQLSNKPYHNF